MPPIYEYKTHIFNILIIILTSIFFQDQSLVWMAASQQHKVDNQSSKSHILLLLQVFACSLAKSQSIGA